MQMYSYTATPRSLAKASTRRCCWWRARRISTLAAPFTWSWTIRWALRRPATAAEWRATRRIWPSALWRLCFTWTAMTPRYIDYIFIFMIVIDVRNANMNIDVDAGHTSGVRVSAEIRQGRVHRFELLPPMGPQWGGRSNLHESRAVRHHTQSRVSFVI